MWITEGGLLSLVKLSCKHSDLNSFNKLFLEKKYKCFDDAKNSVEIGIECMWFEEFVWMDEFLWLPFRTFSYHILNVQQKSLHGLNEVKSPFGTTWLVKQLMIMIWKKFYEMDLLVFSWKEGFWKKKKKNWSLWKGGFGKILGSLKE